MLASVVLALAAYQLILAAIGYRKLPVIDARPGKGKTEQEDH